MKKISIRQTLQAGFGLALIVLPMALKMVEKWPNTSYICQGLGFLITLMTNARVVMFAKVLLDVFYPETPKDNVTPETPTEKQLADRERLRKVIQLLEEQNNKLPDLIRKQELVDLIRKQEDMLAKVSLDEYPETPKDNVASEKQEKPKDEGFINPKFLIILALTGSFFAGLAFFATLLAKSDELPTSNSQPTVEIQKSPVEIQKLPVASPTTERLSDAGAATPATSQETKAGGLEPKAGGLEPKAGSQEPKSGGLEPKAGGLEPKAVRTDSKYGTCKGELCFAPALALQAFQYNFDTGEMLGGVAFAGGYGVIWHTWIDLGVAVYAGVQFSSANDNRTRAQTLLMFNVANYFAFGPGLLMLGRTNEKADFQPIFCVSANWIPGLTLSSN